MTRSPLPWPTPEPLPAPDDGDEQPRPSVARTWDWLDGWDGEPGTQAAAWDAAVARVLAGERDAA